MAEYYTIHPVTPAERQILKVTELINSNKIAIYPTDSVYGLGCKLTSKAGIERIARLKGIKTKRAEFSFLFANIKNIEKYTMHIEKWIFRLLKKNLPGPFTFILPANKNIPKIIETSRKTIGVRIPDNKIVRNIIEKLGEPLLNTSVYDNDQIIEYTTDPELIYDRYKNIVDVVVNGGHGANRPSTVVDCTNNEPEIIRQGIGKLIL